MDNALGIEVLVLVDRLQRSGVQRRSHEAVVRLVRVLARGALRELVDHAPAET